MTERVRNASSSRVCPNLSTAPAQRHDRSHWFSGWLERQSACFISPSRCTKGHPTEGIAVGFVFLIYGIIACILASGCTLLISALVMLVSRWWPPLVRVQSTMLVWLAHAGGYPTM